MKNPPAFPVVLHYVEDRGMSLRDYFAGQALAGNMASMNPGHVDQHFAKSLAKDAYLVADAMLTERAKEPAQ